MLVIDDASPDGTQDAVLSKIEQYPGRVYMETRQGKLGLGTAYIHGFKWALSRQYGYVIEMDADFSRTIPTTCRNSTINAATMVPT